MFIRNCWYVAAWAHEIPENGPFARTAVGEPLLLYRPRAGEVVAIEDRCCHRAPPLSNGRREGDCVRCGCHGLLFDARGTCIEVPGSERVPPKARLRRFPVVVRNRWVFVWMGDEARADDALLPDNFSCEHPDWKHLPGYMHYDTPHLLICDNLLDFSHLSWVHEKTLGGANAIARARADVERVPRGVRVTRRVYDVPPHRRRGAGGRPRLTDPFTNRQPSTSRGAIPMNTLPALRRLCRAAPMRLLALLGALAAGSAAADIHVGVILSTTGPGASLGIPEEQSLRLWPAEMAGEKLVLTVLNDGTDTGTATKHAQRLVSEDKVDVILGSSVTPTSLAVVEIAGSARVPVVSLAGGGAIVLPQDGPRKWAFKLSPTEAISIGMVLDHAARRGAKTLGLVVAANSYGEGFAKVTEQLAPGKGIKVVGAERYNPTDQSVTAQVVKLMAANPDAVYILSSGTPGALPHIELAKHAFKGPIYQTQGVANNDFLRVGGKDLDGGFMTVAPVLVAEQLPDTNASKKPAVDFVQRFEGKYGAGSRSLFAATAWDAMILTQQAAREALKKAKPGTAEFRAALRDALENLRDVVAAQGVFNMSAQDHNGVDARSQVMVRIEGGRWVLQP